MIKQPIIGFPDAISSPDIPQVQDTLAPELQTASPELVNPVQKDGRTLQLDKNTVLDNANVLAQPIKESADIKQKAVSENTKADIAINDKKAQLLDEKANIDEKYLSDLEKLHQDQTIQQQERLNKIEESINAAAAFRLKPGGVFRKNGSQVQALISAGIGGFLEPILKTNRIQDILDRAIDRDIEAQKQEKDTLNNSVVHLRQLDSLYTDESNRQVGRLKFEKAARATALVDSYEAQLTRLNNPKLIAKGMEQLANLKAWQADKVEDIRRFETNVGQNDLNRRSRELENARNRAAAAARQKAQFKFEIDKEARAQERARLVAKAKAEGELNNRAIYNPKNGKIVGVTANSITTKQREELNTAVTSTYQASSALKEFVELAKKNGKVYGSLGSKFFNTKEGIATRAAYARYLVAKAQAKSGKVVSDKEIDRLKLTVPENTWFTGDNSQAWDDELRSLGRDVEFKLNASGITNSSVYTDIVEAPRLAKEFEGQVSPKELITHIADGPQGLNPSNNARIEAVKAFAKVLKSNPSASVLVRDSLNQAERAINETGTSDEKRKFAEILRSTRKELKKARAKEAKGPKDLPKANPKIKQPIGNGPITRPNSRSK